MNAPLLQMPLGAGRLLARPGDRRLWLLDAPAAALWDLHASGLDASALAELLTARFGLAPAIAQRQIEDTLDQWRQAGLLETGGRDTVADKPPPMPRPAPLAAGAWPLRVADRWVGLGVADPGLCQSLPTWLPPASGFAGAVIEHHLALDGPAHAWRLTRDGQPVAAGGTLDAALLALLQTLTALGCAVPPNACSCCMAPAW